MEASPSSFTLPAATDHGFIHNTINTLATEQKVNTDNK